MDAHVLTLLSRVRARLRGRQAARVGGLVGVIAFGVLVGEAVLARIIPLPDALWARTLLLSSPLFASMAAYLRPVDERRLLREAGTWMGEPALLLAMNEPGPLAPLSDARAVRKANGALSPERAVDPWLRGAVLLMIPAALAAFAPGRAIETPLLDAQAAHHARSIGRALRAESLPDSISRDRQEAIRRALAELDRATVDASAVEAAVAELKSALEDAGATWEAFTNAAAASPLLAPTWKALDRGDTDAALRALRALSEKLEAGGLKASDLKAASNALLAAVGGASSADRRALDDAARAMASGDGSGLEAALADVIARTGPPDSTMRAVEKAIVALERTTGRPSDVVERTVAPSSTNGTRPAPRGPTTTVIPAAFDPRQLDPRQREILRKYFSQR